MWLTRPERRCNGGDNATTRRDAEDSSAYRLVACRQLLIAQSPGNTTTRRGARP
jgi:hypothetical protein